MQFAVVAGLLVVPGSLAGGYGFTASAWWAALYTGVIVSAVAFALQLYGQRRVSPSRTALVLELRPRSPLTERSVSGHASRDG